MSDKTAGSGGGGPVAWAPVMEDDEVERLLMLGGRARSPTETLDALRDAAWEARMDGGCHTRTSEILTVWERALRAALNPDASVHPIDHKKIPETAQPPRRANHE